MKSYITATAIILLLSALPVMALEPKEPRVFEGDPFAKETKEDRDARMAWFREAKFGMFIHWGVYAVLAGDYKGYRDAEWIMRGGEIPADEYRAYAKDFMAENYNPEAWAGMKRIKAASTNISKTSRCLKPERF